jgi:hypothetical protein
MSFDFQWNGDQVEDEVHKRLVGDLHKMAQTVVDITHLYAPKRTGFMVSQETYVVDEANLSVQFIAGAGYDMFQEFGTRYSMPHPHWRPALNTVGPIFGFQTEFVFNTFATDSMLLAHGPTFQMHTGLTDKQKAHVRKNLKPASERHHIGNVSRAKLTVKTTKKF